MKNNNDTKFILTYAAAVVIVLCVLAYVFTCIGCNSPKATAKRDAKRIAKAQSRNPLIMASACASFYPPTDSTSERIVYKQGKVIEKKVPELVYVNCDSAVAAAKVTGGKSNQVKVPCPPCDSIRVDTLEAYKYQRDVERAKTQQLEMQLQAEKDSHSKDNAANGATIAKLKTERNYWMWALLGLGAYTILRWLVRYFSKGMIKLL